MRKWTVRAAQAVLVGAAFAAAGAGVANADSTSGDHSILGGTQAQVPVTVAAPVNIPVTGNALNLLTRESTATANSGKAPSTARLNYKYRAIDNSGASSSSGAVADNAYAARPIAAPITICGNAMASDGIGAAACKGHASVSDEAAQASDEKVAQVAQPAAPAASAAPVAPACPAAKAAEPAAPAAPAQQAAPAVPPCAAKAVTAPVAQSARTVGKLNIIRHAQDAPAAAQAPLTICGNAGVIRGIAAATCEGNAAFKKTAAAAQTVGAAS